MNGTGMLLALVAAPVLLAVAAPLWGADSRERPESPEWERRLRSPMDDLRPSSRGASRTTPVVLRDGRRMVVRPVHAEDRPAIKALFERLSRQSLAQRFHSAGLRITDTVVDVVTAGHVLVAETEGVIVGLASYHPDAGTRQAEAAIVVDDAVQGRGIGLALATCLSRDAYRAGMQQLRAEVQGSNRAMLKLLRRLNLPVAYTWADGVLQVDITLEPDPAHRPLIGDGRTDTARKTA